MDRTPESDSAPQGALVVVAEDIAALRLLLQRVLEGAGYKVVAFSDGEQAHQAVRAMKPALIVTDICMPGLSGIDLMTRIRASGDMTPMLVLSAYFDEESHLACLRQPNVGRLAKPFGLTDLTRAVAMLLRKPAVC
jgi:CheY-like chemotaxis protein